MNPRTKNIPLTPEDLEIRIRVDVRFLQLVGPRPIPEWASFCWILSDRRDAELMYRIEVCREFERLHPDAFTQWAGYGWVHSMMESIVDSGGSVGFTGSDVRYFG